MHACVYIVYNSDLRHWAAINVINGRESLTILILSLAATGITKYSFTHTRVSLSLSLPHCRSLPFPSSLPPSSDSESLSRSGEREAYGS